MQSKRVNIWFFFYSNNMNTIKIPTSRINIKDVKLFCHSFTFLFYISVLLSRVLFLSLVTQHAAFLLLSLYGWNQLRQTKRKSKIEIVLDEHIKSLDLLSHSYRLTHAFILIVARYLSQTEEATTTKKKIAKTKCTFSIMCSYIHMHMHMHECTKCACM